MYRFYLTCFFLLIPAAMLVAQTARGKLDRIQEHYDALEFQQAIALGDSVLNSREQLLPTDALRLNRTLALARYNLGDLAGSRAHFLSVLSIQPDYHPDPAEVSPKIIRFFDELRLSANTPAGQSGEPQRYIRYLPATDLRPAAAWRSVLIPGWGQAHKGQKRRALLLGGLAWGSLLATGVASRIENNARDDYNAALDPTDITRKYKRLDQWYQARQYLTYATMAAWLINLIDANWSSYAALDVVPNPAGKPVAMLTFSLPLR